MPAGTTCPRPPVKVVEKATVQACISIARKVQEARRRAGDTAGSDVARLIARLMEEELLEPVRMRGGVGMGMTPR